MEHRRHNTSIPLTLLLTTCALLILFLPAAISMNSPDASVVSVSPNFEFSDDRPSETSNTNHLGTSQTTSGIFSQGAPGAAPSSQNTQLQKRMNKTGSLTLKTAAIVGSSSAVAAAFVASGGLDSSPSH